MRHGKETNNMKYYVTMSIQRVYSFDADTESEAVDKAHSQFITDILDDDGQSGGDDGLNVIINGIPYKGQPIAGR